jgi:hypothetical protein
MSFGDLLFKCQICRHDVFDIPRNGKDRHLRPICQCCEQSYSDRKPTHGAFMDRRFACQLSALANALSNQAYQIEWSRKYGRA